MTNEQAERMIKLLEAIFEELRQNPRAPKIGVASISHETGELVEAPFTVDEAPVRG